jgi:aspartate aminotransferase
VLELLGNHVWNQFTRAGLQLPKPVGGFYVFVDFENFRDRFKEQGITTSDELCARLLEDTGVAVLPGSVFGRDKSELTTRMAYVDFDGARALIALRDGKAELNEDFLRTYCPNMVEAVMRVVNWLPS